MDDAHGRRRRDCRIDRRAAGLEHLAAGGGSQLVLGSDRTGARGGVGRRREQDESEQQEAGHRGRLSVRRWLEQPRVCACRVAGVC
jgi:hypothetical protein